MGVDLGWGSGCDRRRCRVKIRLAGSEAATPTMGATGSIGEPNRQRQFGEQESHRHIKEAAQAEPIHMAPPAK